MIQKLKILIVNNNINWPSFPQKLQRLQDKVANYVTLSFDTVSTTYSTPSFIPIPNSPGGFIVDPQWIRSNLLPLGVGKYDLILFTLSNSEWSGGTCNGYTYEYEIPELPIAIVHADESEILYNNSIKVTVNGIEYFQYDAWYSRTEHEVYGHCFSQLTKRVPDDSHAVEATTGGLDTPAALSRYDWSKYTPVSDRKGLTEQVNSTLRTTIAYLQSIVADLTQRIQLGNLTNALIQGESQGDDYAFNPNDVTGPAYGCLQIHQSYLTDANEWMKTNYTLKSLLGNRPLSIKVFNAYMSRYATSKRIGRPVTSEDRARIHNGGPNGWNNPATLDYWNKVQKYL